MSLRLCCNYVLVSFAKIFFGFSFAFPFSSIYSVYTDFQEFQDEELYQDYPSNLPSYGVLSIPSCSPPSLKKDSSMCLIKDLVKLIAELVKINKKYIQKVSHCPFGFMVLLKSCLSDFFLLIVTDLETRSSINVSNLVLAEAKTEKLSSVCKL